MPGIDPGAMGTTVTKPPGIIICSSQPYQPSPCLRLGSKNPERANRVLKITQLCGGKMMQTHTASQASCSIPLPATPVAPRVPYRALSTLASSISSSSPLQVLLLYHCVSAMARIRGSSGWGRGCSEQSVGPSLAVFLDAPPIYRGRFQRQRWSLAASHTPSPQVEHSTGWQQLSWLRSFKDTGSEQGPRLSAPTCPFREHKLSITLAASGAKSGLVFGYSHRSSF